MSRKIAAVVSGAVLGIAIGFARAGAFPFWSSESPQATPHASPAPKSETPSASHEPAPPNQPEPTERLGVALPSLAPLVKRVMPTVVNVAVVQEVKTSGFPFGGPEGPEGGPEAGPGGPGGQGGGGNPFGPGESPFGQDPFEQFRHFFGQQMPKQLKLRGTYRTAMMETNNDAPKASETD